MAGLLPRFFLMQQKIEDERKLAKIILETGCSSEEAGGTIAKGADGHDWARRRGLPLISPGVRGVVPGTDPVAELLQKEARRERRR